MSAVAQWVIPDSHWMVTTSGGGEVINIHDRQNQSFDARNSIVGDFIVDIGNFFPNAAARFNSRTVLIRDLGDNRLSLTETLPVVIESQDGQFTVFSYDLNEFAFSENELDAVDAFKAVVVDLYFLLKEEQANLGLLPQKHWNFLQSDIPEN